MNNVKEMQEKNKSTTNYEKKKSIVHKQTGNGAQKLQTVFNGH